MRTGVSGGDCANATPLNPQMARRTIMRTNPTDVSRFKFLFPGPNRVVISVKTQRGKCGGEMFISRLKNSVSLFAILAAATAPHNAGAQMVAANSGTQAQSNVFDLGEIEQVTITASPFSQAISRSVVTGEETFKFNALTLDRAVDLAAGVQSGSTGGPRNERLFFVRGFDRFQSPLYVDGIRVYLPADNRVDLGFFNTANLAQIQIQKGYVSVLSGPGAMGGAINLVTRKPTQPFE